SLSSSLPFRPDPCDHLPMGRARLGLNAVLIAAGLLLSAFLWLSASGNTPGFLPFRGAQALPTEVTLARQLTPARKAAPKTTVRKAPAVAPAPVVVAPVVSAQLVSVAPRPLARRHARVHRPVAPRPAVTPPTATPPPPPPPPPPSVIGPGNPVAAPPTKE